MAENAAVEALDSLIKQCGLTEADCNKEMKKAHLEKICRSFCSQWRLLTPHLGTAEMSKNEQDCSEEQQKRSFFLQWKETMGPGATYKKLVGSLLEVGCREDAERVCKMLWEYVSTRNIPPMKPKITFGQYRGGGKMAAMYDDEAHLKKTVRTAHFASLPTDLHMDLKQQLQLHLKEVINLYASFVSTTCTEIRNSSVTVDELRSFLLNQSAFLSDNHQRPDLILYCHLREKLEQAETIIKIFEIISVHHASFINHEPFTSIARRFGTAKSREKLDKFLDHLQNYLDIHNLTEYTEVSPMYGVEVDPTTKLVLRFDFDRTLRIAKVFELRTSFAEALGLRGCVLRLHEVDESDGAVVTLLCPPAVAQYLFNSGTKFTEKQLLDLRALLLLTLEYCGHHFDFREAGEDSMEGGVRGDGGEEGPGGTTCTGEGSSGPPPVPADNTDLPDTVPPEDELVRSKYEETTDSEADDTQEDEGEENGVEGTDEPDLGMVDVKLYLNKNLSLLDYSRDKILDPDLLRKILQSLSDKGELGTLNQLDGHGYAAIHYIVKRRKHKRRRDLLEQLVISGADVDLLTSCREELTPLHLAVEAKDVECLKTLISLDADVNKEDSLGKTPLDFASIAGKLVFTPTGNSVQMFALQQEEEMGVASEGVGVTGDEAEESPVLRPKEKRPKLDQLQQREDSRLTKMTQLLESVGAVKGSSSQTRLSLMSSTEEGRTHAHISAAAYDPARFRKINTRWYRDEHDKVREKLRQEVAVLEPTRALEVVGSLRQLEEYRRTCGSRILCLDGGGIRGLIQMTVLREIERRTGKRIVDLFDWIVGTSTGGIIALALTYGPKPPGPGRKTVRQLRDIYWSMKDEIFGASQDGLLGFLAKGNTEKLEATLKDWLGSDVKLDHENYPKVLIPAVCKKDSNLDLHFFNNCFGDDYSKEFVWKVGRYTSAAPFYFTEFENYIDGGMLANNPSEAALTTIQDYYHHKQEKIPVSLLVSVGSGINPAAPLGEIDIKKNLLSPRAYLDLMEVLESAVLSKQTAASCMTRCREQGIDYFRFNPELSEKVDSDQQDSSVLHKMILRTRQYLREPAVREDMDKLIQLLNESELTST